MRMRRFRVVSIGALIAAVVIAVVAAPVFGQWPTTCVGLNDIVEAHLGNDGNVGIYQRVFGAQAEQACQNDHRDDVRDVFAWALDTVPQATADIPNLAWPTDCVELNDIVEAHLGNDANVGIYQRVFGDQAEPACRNDHRADVQGIFAWAFDDFRSPPATAAVAGVTEAASACVSGGAVGNAGSAGLVSDCAALLASRDTLAGSTTLNWSTTVAIDQWEGITIAGTPRRVTELRLPDRDLDGAIPAELGTLDRLRWLDLKQNRLQGQLPPDLGRLRRLRLLALGQNDLAGTIPAALGSLTNLHWLTLSTNRLSGEIPPELGRLTRLLLLDLADNQLTGPIPGDLGNLTDLGTLGLGRNQLAGCIPEELRNVKSVDGGTSSSALLATNGDFINEIVDNFPEVNLPYCDDVRAAEAERAALVEIFQTAGGSTWIATDGWLTEAPIGEWFGVRTDQRGRVTGINLAGNQLHGEVPHALVHLSQLHDLNLSGNQLHGSIPIALADLTYLTVLNLSANRLQGAIPTALGELRYLAHLVLHDNELQGIIPPALGRLTNLRTLSLGRNQLRGAIPPTLGDLSYLSWLGLQHNQLTGEIPASLGRLSNLEVLALGANHLHGPIPADLGDLRNLTVLSLHTNSLEGDVPPELDRVANLRRVQLAGNALAGCLPASWRHLPEHDLSQLGLPFCDGE